MNKQAYRQGFIDACNYYGIDTTGLAKKAGVWTELLTPVNAVPFASDIGSIAALATKTKSLKSIAKNDKDYKATILNLLAPGVGTYRAYKRYGAMIRGPEIRKTKEYIQKLIDEKGREAVEDLIEKDRGEIAEQALAKKAGWVSETLGTIINPATVLGAAGGAYLGDVFNRGVGAKPKMSDRIAFGLFGGAIGGLLSAMGGVAAASATKTRTLGQQAYHDMSAGQSALDFIVPGRAQYNAIKRLFAGAHSPTYRRFVQEAKEEEDKK